MLERGHDEQAQSSERSLRPIDAMLGRLERHVWNSMPGQCIVMAILLAAAYYADNADTRVLPPGSPEVQSLLSPPAIEKTAEGFKLTYTARYVPAFELFVQCERAGQGNITWYRSKLTGQDAVYETGNETLLREIRQDLIAADQPQAGTKIIRGRLTDRLGKPMANVNADVMGDYLSINNCTTRADGTFCIILSDPKPRSNLSAYLRFRLPNGGARFTSHGFTLTDVNPVAYIDASRTVFERTNLLYWLAGAVAVAFVARDVQRLVRHVRSVRRKPGICPTCGYDLRGTPGERCSECGVEIPGYVRAELGGA